MERYTDYSEVIHSAQGFSRDLKISHSTRIRVNPLHVNREQPTSEGLGASFTSLASATALPGESFAFQWHPDLPDDATPVEINRAVIEGGTIVSR